MQDFPLQGTLPDVFLPRLIARLHRQGFEGIVRLASEESMRVLYFRDGEIASAASNAEADRLAHILIREGRLTSEQLELARTRVEPGGSVGKALIDMGFLSPGELLQGARRQVRDILAACFALRAGTFQVEAGTLPPEVTALGVPTRRLIFDCIVEAGDRDLVVREMGSMESVYRPTGDLPPMLETLKLDPESDRLARTLDGLLTLRDLSGRTRLDDFAVSKVVLALEVLGMAEREDIAAPAPRATGRAIAIAAEAPRREPPVPDVIPPAVPVPSSPDGGAAPEDEPILLQEEDAPEAYAVESPPADVPAAGVPSDDAPAAGAPDPDPAGMQRPGIEVTPPPAPEPEPPAIPAEELPAFARPATEPRWEIDPATGERVHVGPVEVTFDGRVAVDEAAGPGRTRLFVAAAGIVLVVGAAAAFILVRREARTTVAATVAGRIPADSAAAAPATPAGAIAAGPEAPGPEPAPAAAAPAATGPEAPGPEPAPAGPASQPAAPERPAAAEPPSTTATTPPVAAPTATPAADPTPAPSIPPGGLFPAERVDAAFRALEGGDAGGGARIFQELASAQPPGTATLQVMIACQDETLRNARARSGGGDLFFLPYAYRGRDCFRVCWGLYPTTAAAESAVPSVPQALLGPGGRPVPVALARLRPGP
jgi:hypothetical protein